MTIQTTTGGMPPHRPHRSCKKTIWAVAQKTTVLKDMLGRVISQTQSSHQTSIEDPMPCTPCSGPSSSALAALEDWAQRLV